MPERRKSVEGERVVEINGVCASGSPKEIATELVEVEDGGDRFYQAYYASASRQIVRFDLNGYA